MRAATELRRQIESALAGRIPAALSPRPLRSPELISCGIPEVDRLLGGGLPLGAIVELAGARSAGRTTLALAILAEVTSQGHCCAYVDSADALDPLSAAAMGVQLQRLLWVRLGSRRSEVKAPHISMGSTKDRKNSTAYRSLEAALRATDLLLNGGGFRAVVLDLADLASEIARRTPLATWYRFRLQAEKSQTLLLVLAPCNSDLQSCAAVSLECDAAMPDWRQAEPDSPRLLAEMHYRFHLNRNGASGGKKPPASIRATEAETSWHGTTSWTG